MNRATLNLFKTAVLFLFPGAVCALLGYAIAGWAGLMVCAAAHSLFATFAFLWADEMSLRQHCAQWVPNDHAPGLYALASELARRAAIPMPALYMLPEAAPQLMVVGRTPERAAIAVSEGLLALLNREELAAVMAHAIGHIRSGETRPMTMAAGLVGGLVAVSKFFRWRNLLGPRLVRTEQRDGMPADAFLWTLIAPVAAALIRSTVFPSRQVRGDAGSVRLIGDVNPLRSALRKIAAEAPYSTPKVVSPATAHLFFSRPTVGDGLTPFFETHARTSDRLRNLDTIGWISYYCKRVETTSSSRRMEQKTLSNGGINI